MNPYPLSAQVFILKVRKVISVLRLYDLNKKALNENPER